MKELSALNKYLWRYRGRLALGTLFVMLSNFFLVLQPIVFRDAIDDLEKFLKQIEGATGSADDFGVTLLKYGGMFLLLALISGLFTFLMRQTIIVVSRKIEKDLKDDIYSHLQSLSLSFYRKNKTGDIMARATEDVAAVRMYLGPGIMYSINFASRIILVMIVMFSVNVELSLYVLTPMPILAVSIFFVNRIILKRSTRLQEQMSAISTFVQETYSGIRVIKSFSAEKLLSRFFDKESEDYKKRSLSLVQVNATFIPLIILLIGLSTLITIYVGGQLYFKGEISLGNIVQFFLYVNSLTWPVAAIGWVSALIQRAAASQKRINHLMVQESEIINGEIKLDNLKGGVRFDKVSFTYPESGIKAIQDVSFEVKAGEIVGIVGKTGSGKSTLADLILRQYDPDKGNILVDNVPLKKLDLENYRSQIGYVPQDNFLFSDSIRNNILMGSTEEYTRSAAVDEVEEVTKIADLYRDITDFPEDFKTKLGERGITLSGGQKQRLSIARAIYGNPSLLVFDDSFSAVDTHTEAAILKSLGSYIKDRTTFLVSHRVSTVKNADHIIVLDKGKVIEEGTHDELIQNHLYYYSLYKKQLLEKELSATG